MKIAHIVCVAPPYGGGMGKVAFELAKQQAQAEHTVTLFTAQTSIWTRTQVKHHDRLTVVRLRPLVRIGNAGCLFQLLWKLQSWDIVHLHYPFFGSAELVWGLKKIFRPSWKLVITYHMDVVGTGVKKYCFDWHTKHILPRILRTADTLIMSSRDYIMHSHAKNLLLKNPRLWHEIGFGVDHAVFTPQERDQSLLNQYQITNNKTILLFVGSLDTAHPFKGLDVLLHALAYYQTHHLGQTTDQLVLLVVGEGNMRPVYKRLSQSLSLEKQVIFTGYVPDETLPCFYQSSDIFILPSQDRSEAFGLVLLEAQACAKPVIASDLPGVRTIVQHGWNGWLVPPGNVAELAFAIQKLVSHPAQAHTFGMRGRDRILTNYTWESVHDRVMHLYDMLVTHATKKQDL